MFGRRIVVMSESEPKRILGFGTRHLVRFARVFSELCWVSRKRLTVFLGGGRMDGGGGGGEEGEKEILETRSNCTVYQNESVPVQNDGFICNLQFWFLLGGAFREVSLWC